MVELNHYKQKGDLLVLSHISLFIAFVLLMFNGRGVANSLFVFNINVSYAYTLIFVLQLIALLIALSTRKIRIDTVTSLLYVQILLFTVIFLIYPNSIDGMKYYLALLQAFVIYLFCIITPLDKLNKSILLLAKLSILIIAFQLVSVSVVMSSISIEAYLVKSFISIPLGESNYIAAFINMFLVIVLNLEHKKIKKFAFILLSAVSIIITKSDAGLIFFVLVLLVSYSSKIMSTNSVKNIVRNILIIIVSFIVIILIFRITYELFPSFYHKYAQFFSNLFLGGYKGIEEVSNGRLDIYIDSFELFLTSPFMGHGLRYGESLNALSHNIIFDQVLKGGLINLLIFLTYIFIMGKQFMKYKNKSPEVKAIWNMFLIVLLNSLVEPNIGEFGFNFFFWFFCGVGMANCYKLNNKERV